MFDLVTPTHANPAAHLLAPSSFRSTESVGLRALARMLDVLDYGVLQVLQDGCVLYANRVARAEMTDQHPLQLLGHDLRARCPRDVVGLHNALSGALNRGVQTLLRLGGASPQAIHVAVMPLGDACQRSAAIVFGRRRVCEDLSSDAYARQHGLTLAEARVLHHLCAGERPQGIADLLGVKLSTVRTQIGSIRGKTGSRDIGALVQCVARLPPLPCVTHRASGPAPG